MLKQKVDWLFRIEENEDIREKVSEVGRIIEGIDQKGIRESALPTWMKL